MKVRFTPAGERQFLAVVEHILADRPSAARRFYRRAQLALKRLERFPNSGRRLPEFPELPFRELLLRPYRFFYRINRGTVWVVAVWHGAQLPAEPEGPEDA